MDGENLKKFLKIAALTLIALAIALIAPVKAQITNVAILPATITIPSVGAEESADLNITDVTNLYAYEIMIWFDKFVVNATNVTRPAGHFMEPQIDPGNQFVLAWQINNNFNATHGRIYLGFTLLNPEVARNGSGILARIFFKGLTINSTTIVLNDYPGELGPVKLGGREGLEVTKIAHTATGGSINVVPEFPVGLLLTFLAATAVTVSFA